MKKAEKEFQKWEKAQMGLIFDIMLTPRVTEAMRNIMLHAMKQPVSWLEASGIIERVDS